MSLAAAAILAHGLGERSDLPLPKWMFAYGAGFAVAISFAALRILWPSARLARAARGRPVALLVDRIAAGAAVAGRAGALALYAVVLRAAFAGSDAPVANIAPVAVYVVVWVGVPVVCALVGDVWAALNPHDTIAWLAGGRGRGRADPAGRRPPRWADGMWVGAAGLVVFTWLELAYHDPGSPRAVGVFLAGLLAVAVAGSRRWGRTWLDGGDPLRAFTRLLATMAPLHRAGGRLHRRWPLAGLSEVTEEPGLAAFVFVALGSTTFDGLSRTRFWGDVLGDNTGWSATFFNTLGLVWVIALVAVAFAAAAGLSARVTGASPAEAIGRYVPTLLPIALAYAVAHYFSLFVFEGQRFLIHLSDPLERGWDLFGTADWTVNFRLVSTSTIAWVQAGAIVAGHVAAVVAAHDRAVEHDRAAVAVRGQYPLLGVMVLYTVVGLLLLLGG